MAPHCPEHQEPAWRHGRTLAGWRRFRGLEEVDRTAARDFPRVAVFVCVNVRAADLCRSDLDEIGALIRRSWVRSPLFFVS